MFQLALLPFGGDAHGLIVWPSSRSTLNAPHYNADISWNSEPFPIRCNGVQSPDYCPHCLNGNGPGNLMGGASGSPGQSGNSFDLYDYAKASKCEANSADEHTWEPQKVCKAESVLDLTVKFTTAHGGVMGAWICFVEEGGYKTFYDANEPLFDDVSGATASSLSNFDDCWQRMEYVPSATDPGANFMYGALGETNDITGGFRIPTAPSGSGYSGHALVMWQWTTSNSFYSERFIDLQTANPTLWNALNKNSHGNCSGSCSPAAADVLGDARQNAGDYLNEQFRQLIDIEISPTAGDQDCVRTGSDVFRPFYWLDSTTVPTPAPTPEPTVEPIVEEPTIEEPIMEEPIVTVPEEPTVEPTPAPTPEPTPAPTDLLPEWAQCDGPDGGFPACQAGCDCIGHDIWWKGCQPQQGWKCEHAFQTPPFQ